MKKICVLTLAIAALSQAAVPGDAIENLYRGKLGRNTPAEEKRLDEERATAAFRAEPAPAGLSYLDQFYNRKLGRYTPAEEARQESERANAAFRAEPAPRALPYIDQFMRAKLGRTTER